MVPALFGGLLLGVYKQSGKKRIKNKWILALFPIVVMGVGILIWPKLTSYQGYCILGMIVLTLAAAYALYKAGIVKEYTVGEDDK